MLINYLFFCHADPGSILATKCRRCFLGQPDKNALANLKITLVLLLTASLAHAQPGTIPAGFTPIFNGKDLTGWHTSRTSHQGTTGNFYVENGVITLKQYPYGQGGVLLTNTRYGNFELYLEAKIDSFCNGGIFLRSSESGVAYQIELATPGGLGDLLSERMRVSKEAHAVNIARVWKPSNRTTDGWNSFRIRMEGAVPRIRLWVNGELMWDVTEPTNDFIAGATTGMIGLQAHWSAVYSPAAEAFSMAGSWKPGAAHRFRNIAIRRLP